MSNVNPDPDQYMPALDRANAVRMRQTEIRHGLRARDVSFEEALTDEATGRMRVYELALCLPATSRPYKRRPGRAPGKAYRLAARVCYAANVSHFKVVGDLTERQRKLLVKAAEEHAH